MFGLKILTRKGLRELRKQAKNEALLEFIEILKSSNKVYLEPVVLAGNHQRVNNSLFITTAPNTTAITICGETSNNLLDGNFIEGYNHCVKVKE